MWGTPHPSRLTDVSEVVDGPDRWTLGDRAGLSLSDCYVSWFLSAGRVKELFQYQFLLYCGHYKRSIGGSTQNLSFLNMFTCARVRIGSVIRRVDLHHVSW